MLRTTLSLMILGLGALQAQPTQQYSHGDPTDAEQLMLEYINRARANPAAEVQLFLNSTDEALQANITGFKVNTEALVDAFNAIPVAPPLAFQPQLMEAALKHSELLRDNDAQSHQLPGELDLSDRILAEGYTFTGSITFGENVYSYMLTPFFGHAAFEVDWGYGPDGMQDPAGHRINIHDIDKTTATEIGISILSDPESFSDPATGPYVVTQDFARPSVPTYYALGVVYVDSDEDGFYSEGEGLAGVTITPDQGDWYAVTSSSGGYAIPLGAVSGEISLTASGGELSEALTDSFTYSATENVKVDFIVEPDDGSSGGDNEGETPVVVKDPETDFGSDAKVFGGNYVETGWFGNFFNLAASGADIGWLYHEQHGFIYYIGNEDELWFYSGSLNWTYTDRTRYPFMYLINIGWVYYYPQTGTQRFFYDVEKAMNFFNDPTVDSVLRYY